ncbi:MAG TPA: hypothetical protein ENN29_12615 [Candidatus Hydrogenedentes bacterium]|nr:hypothetical protein [Candidatus Hydrogenedentota bacterium]
MERLAAHIPEWTGQPSGAKEPVVLCQCALARNLREFVFPQCCIDDERRAAQARVRALLNADGVIPNGAYYAAAELDEVGLRFLAERRLITYEMLCAVGPRGVYVSENQSLAIMVNSSDHVVIRALTANGKVEDAWKRVNDVDDALGRRLDFSYHERLGYLTRSLRMVGTGLKVSVLLHLPGLVMMRAIHDLERRMRRRRLHLCGMTLGDPRAAAPPPPDILPGSAYGLTAAIEPVGYQCLYMDLLGALAAPTANTVGNLFLLGNGDTLGLSEAEIIFHAEQAVADIVESEGEARRQLKRERGDILLDSISRALGIASGARQLGMGEALTLASLIRLADAMGLMAGFDRTALNTTLLECQSAHLQIMRGISPDAPLLAGERARLFRTLFSGATIN